jgi:deoxyribodipyrimidine photo-lyase
MTDFPASRAAGLDAMASFVPAMGRRYANGRNVDHGRGAHKAVSQLSPYIRRRLVTEQEVAAAAIAAHGLDAAEKFVEEVFWRTYFKGWLERRPQVWASYTQGLQSDFSALQHDRKLRHRVERAMEAKTGLAYFDSWATELLETGYLHNHARMWFASIWIFTLGLPWRLGADFFYRHLLDGDAASNTLGWRWVAGLHTLGKPYPARADNIKTCTNGRFAPRAGELAEVTQGLEATEPGGLPPVLALREFNTPTPSVPTALLITDEDCRLDDFALSQLDLRAAATLATSHLRSPLEVSEAVVRFEAGALADTAARAGVSAVALRAGHPGELARWAQSVGVTQVVTPYATRGTTHDWLCEATPALAANGITLAEWRREWDAEVWPLATAGFFKVRQQIPRVLGELGLV